MKQKKKEITAVVGGSWKGSYIYTEIITLIEIVDGSSIKLDAVGQSDFLEFSRIYIGLKKGGKKIEIRQRHISQYLDENSDGLWWIILALVLTIGLGYGIFMK